MTTKPWQEQDPVSLQDEWVNETWAQMEVDAIISHNSPLQDKEAPMAKAEEDIERDSRDETLEENQTISRLKIADATKLESRVSTIIFPRETQEMVTEVEQLAKLSEGLQSQDESEMSIDRCDDALPPPPPPPLNACSAEENLDREGFSSIEGEVAEWLRDAEINSDTTVDRMSPDSQQCPTLLFTELVDREDYLTSEEMTADDLATEENDTQQNVLQDGFDNSEADRNMAWDAVAGINATAHYSPSGTNNSNDDYAMFSPPFADESGEEEEVCIDCMSCQQQWPTHNIRSKPFQASDSANISDRTSPLPAVPSAKQQGVLLSQSQCEYAPRGVNQEAAQQVLGKESPPLSTVAMELSNQGGAASQGSGWVVAVRERLSRAGVKAEGESKQTGGEEGQKEGGLERNKAAGQQHSKGLLTFLKTVQIHKLKTEKYISMSSKHTRMESDSCDDSQSDSGVSADFSPCSTSEVNTTNSTGTPTALPKETPVDREIRRAVEREHSLRRSRGLPNPSNTPEYVEIPLRKSVLCQLPTVKSENYQCKDRQFAGKKMQHEIHEETRREQDLVKLGKVLGVYDKGTVRQLKERKQIFEAFQKPNDSTMSVSTRSKSTSWSSASDISTIENQEDTSSQASTIGGSFVERSPTQTPGGGPTSLTPRGAGFSEGTRCQVIILENNLSVPAQKLYHARREAEPITVVDSGGPQISSSRTLGQDGIKGERQEMEEEEEEEEEEAPRENPFFKLRSSTKLVAQDIREAQEREKELHKQRKSLYGGTEGSKQGGVGGGGVRPASTEGKTPTLCSSSLNGLAVPDLPGSSSRDVTRPPAERQSVGKCGMWPPAQTEEENSDQPKVIHSARTPRQKTPLVQRWESGLVNGHNEDNN